MKYKALLIILAVSLFFYYSYKIDAWFSNGDLGLFLLEAHRGNIPLFGIGVQDHTGIFFQYLKFLYYFFGDSLYRYQYSSIIWAIIGLIFFYGMLRHFFKPSTALITTLLYGLVPYYASIARQGNELSLANSLLIGAIFFLLKNSKDQDIRFCTLAGVFVGAALYFSPIAYWGIIIGGVTILLFSKKSRLLSMAIFFGMIIIVYLPQVVYAFKTSTSLFDRMTAVSFFNSAMWQKGDIPGIIHHLIKSFTPFFVAVDEKPLFYSRTPFVPLLISFISLTGIGLLLREKGKLVVFLALWFSLGSLFAGFATVDIAASRYLAVLPFCFFGVAATVSFIVTRTASITSRYIKTVVMVCFTTVFILFSLYLVYSYYDYHFSNMDYISSDDEFLMRAGNIIRKEAQSSATIYFLADNNKYADSNGDFAWDVRHFKTRDVTTSEELQSILAISTRQKEPFFIVILPNNFNTIESVSYKYKLRRMSVLSSRSNDVIGMLATSSY